MRVPGRVRERLRDDVIRRYLDRLREPRDRGHIELDRDRGPAGQRPQRRPQPAVGQDRRVDAAGDLAQILDGPVEFARDPADLRPELGHPGRHRGLREAKLEAEGDEALLGPVVQVSLDPPPGLIRGGDDPRPRSRQLGAALGVPDRRRDELDEVRHPVRGVRRKRLPPRQHDHHAPQAAFDVDRAGHHRPDAQLAQAVGDGIRHAAPQVLVDPGGAAGPPHHSRRKVVDEFRAHPDRPVDLALPGSADDHNRGPVRLVTAYAGAIRAKEPADFLGDRREDLGRVDAAGDQGGNPAERGLLGQEAGELVTARLQRGPVLRIRDRGGDQVGELRHPLLGVGRQWPLPGPDGDHSPQPAVDVYRHGDRGP